MFNLLGSALIKVASNARTRVFAASRLAVLAVCDQGIASLTNFVPMFFLARYSTASQVGIYALFVTVCTFLTTIEHSFITAPYTCYYRRVKAPAKYSGSIVFHHTAYVGVIATALAVTGLSVTTNRSEYGVNLACAAIVATCLLLCREFARRVGFAHENVRVVLILDSVTGVLQAILMMSLARSKVLTAVSALYAMSCSTAPFVLCGIFAASRYQYDLRAAFCAFKGHWPFARWTALGTCVSALPRQVFPWSLAYFSGTAATGMLAACTGVLQIANPALIGFTNYFAPLASRTYHERGVDALRSVVKNATAVIALLLMTLFLMTVFCGTDLLGFIYGRRFATPSNGAAVILLSLALFCSETTLPHGLAFLALDRPSVNVRASAVALAVTATVGITAVRTFGIYGVGLGLLVAGVAESMTKLLYYVRSKEMVSESFLAQREPVAQIGD